MTVAAHGAKGFVFGKAGEFYACANAVRRLRHVAMCCDAAQWRIRGRWAVYIAQGSAIGDEFDKLGIAALRTGRLRAIRKEAPNREGGTGGEIETASFVRRLVLGTGGAIAWTQAVRHEDGTLGPDVELRAVAGATAWERIVDTGAVDPASLTLSSGRLHWKRSGAARATDLSQGTWRGRCSTGVKGRIVRSEPGFVIFSVPARRRDFRGVDLYGCAMPDGHVFPLGERGAYDAGITQSTVSFGTWAGSFVVRNESYGSETAQASDGQVVDLTTGVGNTIWSLETDDSGTTAGGLGPAAPRATALTDAGLFAGIFPTADGSGEVLGAVSPAGTIATLDTASAKHVLEGTQIDGATVSWTNAGAARSAVVPAD